MDEILEKISENNAEIIRLVNLRNTTNLMPDGEMEYIREKCVKGEPISKEQLLRYAKTYEIKNKLFKLDIENIELKEQIRRYIKLMKDINEGVE